MNGLLSITMEWFTMGIADINYVPKNNLRFEERKLILWDKLFKDYTQLSVSAPKTQNVNLNLYNKD